MAMQTWDAQFAATQDSLKKMADKVRADIRAGRTGPMAFTKDGRIAKTIDSWPVV